MATNRLLGEARFTDVDAAFLLDLRGWLQPRLPGREARVVREVAIVLGELMTNAYRHAQPPFLARLTEGHAIRVEVHDGTASPATGWALGRGLLIVRDLCSDWGVEHRPDGKIVWAEMPDEAGRRAQRSPANLAIT
jgi:hypothetical protein